MQKPLEAHRVIAVVLVVSDDVLLHQQLLNDIVVNARGWPPEILIEGLLRVCYWWRAPVCKQETALVRAAMCACVLRSILILEATYSNTEFACYPCQPQCATHLQLAQSRFVERLIACSCCSCMVKKPIHQAPRKLR